MRTSRLTAVIERTLDAKAAQATDPDTTGAIPAFDPDLPVSAAARGRGPGDVHLLPLDVVPDGSGGLDDLDLVPDGSGRSDDLDLGAAALPTGGSPAPHRRRWLIVPAAACAAAVALAGAVVLSNDDATDVDVRPLEIGDPPAGWLVPAWLPDGMELWGVDAPSHIQADGSELEAIPQLFGDPQGDRAIYVTSNRYVEISPSTAEDVAIRGTTGSAGTGRGAAGDELGRAVRWEEFGIGLTALYRGVSRDEAIAVLDALDWRTDDPRDGYAPPTDDAWPLRGEATSRDRVAHEATLLYSEGVPVTDAQLGQSGLIVHTSSSSTISAGYLETWYLEGSGDGTGRLVSYRNGWNGLGVYWPDGRSVLVSPRGEGQPLTRDALERIATSVTVATEADLTGLRDAAESRTEAVPR